MKKVASSDLPSPIYFTSLADLQTWIKENTTSSEASLGSSLTIYYDEKSERYNAGLSNDDDDEYDWCQAKTLIEAMEKLAAVVKARRPKGVRGLLNPAPKKGLRPV